MVSFFRIMSLAAGSFFSVPRSAAGGGWLGRTYEDCFWLELEFPVSLYDGLGF